MAHFAKIDENNRVVEVIVVNNSDCGNLEFPESESIGQTFLTSIGLVGNWKQTSYNSSFRKNFAGFGYSYDETINAFISDKPHNSWILNEETAKWETPIEYPTDGKLYKWNEEIINWEEIITE
jgi:hypothetical protein